MKKFRITPVQVEILERIKEPDLVFDVFEDSGEGLAGRWTQEQIEQCCKKIEGQFAKEYLDFSEFEDKELLIEILDDATSGAVYFAGLEGSVSKKEEAACHTHADLFDDHIDLFGLLASGSEYEKGKIRPIVRW